MRHEQELSEKTKTTLSFVAFIVIPVTFWLAGLSYQLHALSSQTAKDVEMIRSEINFRQNFERDVIDRLARIEQTLQNDQRRDKQN